MFSTKQNCEAGKLANRSGNASGPTQHYPGTGYGMSGAQKTEWLEGWDNPLASEKQYVMGAGTVIHPSPSSDASYGTLDTQMRPPQWVHEINYNGGGWGWVIPQSPHYWWPDWLLDDFGNEISQYTDLFWETDWGNTGCVWAYWPYP